MLKKRSKQYSKNSSNQGTGEDLDFGWKDILAFIIAFFQVLFPYVLLLLIAFFTVMLLMNFWLN